MLRSARAMAWIAGLVLTSGCRTFGDGSETSSGDLDCHNGASLHYTAAHEHALTMPQTVDLTGEPVLIYYAVDTREKLMQVAIDEDLRTLRAACELTADEARRKRVNWLAFVNSHYMDGKPTFLQCDHGVFSEQAFPTATQDGLTATILQIGNPATYGNDPLAQVKATGFGTYPYAHAKVLKRLLKFAKKLYPPDSYIYNLLIKSHGSADFVLTGFTDQQVQDKDNCFANSGAATHTTLPSIALGDAGLTRDDTGQPMPLTNDHVLLTQTQQSLFLGDEGQPVLGDEGQPVLGEDGQTGLGGEGQFALGDEVGLTAASHFGSTRDQLVGEIAAFLGGGVEGAKERMGYLILEGCFNGGGEAFLDGLPLIGFALEKHLARLFSAKGSLWYRNFDWTKVYGDWLAQNAAATASDLVTLLDGRTYDVVNLQKVP